MLIHVGLVFAASGSVRSHEPCSPSVLHPLWHLRSFYLIFCRFPELCGEDFDREIPFRCSPYMMSDCSWDRLSLLSMLAWSWGYESCAAMPGLFFNMRIWTQVLTIIQLVKYSICPLGHFFICSQNCGETLRTMMKP